MTLSARYLPERFLPDKALDLLDEACSAVRIEAAERPGGPEKPAVTAAHIAALKEFGPCAIHRRSFIRNFVD